MFWTRPAACTVNVDPYQWNTDGYEAQEMDQVAEWLKSSLDLPQYSEIVDVYGSGTRRVSLTDANVELSGKTDFLLKVYGYECGFIEVQKNPAKEHEAQAKAELLLYHDHIQRCPGFVALTDCRDFWKLFWLTEEGESIILEHIQLRRCEALTEIRACIIQSGHLIRTTRFPDEHHALQESEFPLLLRHRKLLMLPIPDDLANVMSDIDESRYFDEGDKLLMLQRKAFLLLRESAPSSEKICYEQLADNVERYRKSQWQSMYT